jgi:uncharacterized protein YjbI with pentapeptide repeats
MLNSKLIGEKIATARKKLNLSQAELAQKVSISPQAVGKWERGESMPDITTLNRLAELLGVDLNYFSDSFHSSAEGYNSLGMKDSDLTKSLARKKKKPSWDLSKLNLTDSDFSGLKNMHEKLSGTNIQHCLFVGSELTGLSLNNNYVQNCDFSDADLHDSSFANSMFSKNLFRDASLANTRFYKCFLEDCDFSGADLGGAEFSKGGFAKNILINARLEGCSFIGMDIQDVVFEGVLENMHFENCSFRSVKFQNASLINTFFKNNKKFKRLQFIDCKADKLTYAFLKNNLADISGITLV